MTVSAYLKQYNRTKKNVLAFVRTHQGIVPIAGKLLKQYADKNQYFRNGTELDHSLLHSTYMLHKTEYEIFYRMKFWDKVKWLLTRNRLSPTDSGTPTERN